MKKGLPKKIKTIVSFCLMFLTVNIVNGQTVEDIDGNIYNVVSIAGLKWIKQNLKVTKYNNGDAITTNLNQADWNSTTSGAYAYPNGSSANVATYGLLYNAYAIRDAKGIAPTGWRVATDEDWKALEVFSGMSTGDADDTGFRGTISGKLKALVYGDEADNINAQGTDEYGMSILPAGYRESTAAGTYLNFSSNANTDRAHFWTSSASGAQNYRRMLTRSNQSIHRGLITVKEGNSVRCVQDIPLPIILKQFDVKKNTNSIELSWSTASELNSGYFEIEKSVDGKTFSTLTKIKAAGSSNGVLKYSFKDENPFNGTSYYRLRETDKDGSSSIYAIRAVDFGFSIPKKVSIFPNPALHDLFINSVGYQGTSLSIKIFALDGSIVHQELLQVQSSRTKLNIINPLVPGVYLVKVYGKDFSESLKVLITD